VSHLVLIVTAAHGGFIPRAQAIVRERGTPEQQAVCEKVWAGAFRSADDMRHYYAVMGPMYARSHDVASGDAGRARTIHSPEPLNRAFGPDGFLRSFDLRGELGRITAPALVLAGRHDWICPPEFSEEIAQLIPRADLRIFEHSSHSIRGDEPEAMVDAILGFVVYR
jgi:proline iminopeptidase